MMFQSTIQISISHEYCFLDFPTYNRKEHYFVITIDIWYFICDINELN